MENRSKHEYPSCECLAAGHPSPPQGSGIIAGWVATKNADWESRRGLAARFRGITLAVALVIMAFAPSDVKAETVSSSHSTNSSPSFLPKSSMDMYRTAARDVTKEQSYRRNIRLIPKLVKNALKNNQQRVISGSPPPRNDQREGPKGVRQWLHSKKQAMVRGKNKVVDHATLAKFYHDLLKSELLDPKEVLMLSKKSPAAKTPDSSADIAFALLPIAVEAQNKLDRLTNGWNIDVSQRPFGVNIRRKPPTPEQIIDTLGPMAKRADKLFSTKGELAARKLAEFIYSVPGRSLKELPLNRLIMRASDSENGSGGASIVVNPEQHYPSTIEALKEVIPILVEQANHTPPVALGQSALSN